MAEINDCFVQISDERFVETLQGFCQNYAEFAALKSVAPEGTLNLVENFLDSQSTLLGDLFGLGPFQALHFARDIVLYQNMRKEYWGTELLDRLKSA